MDELPVQGEECVGLCLDYLSNGDGSRIWELGIGNAFEWSLPHPPLQTQLCQITTRSARTVSSAPQQSKGMLELSKYVTTQSLSRME